MYRITPINQKVEDGFSQEVVWRKRHFEDYDLLIRIGDSTVGDSRSENKEYDNDLRIVLAEQEIEELTGGIFLCDLEGECFIVGDRIIGERIIGTNGGDAGMGSDGVRIEREPDRFAYGDFLRLILSIDLGVINKIYNTHIYRELKELEIYNEGPDDARLRNIIESSDDTEAKIKKIHYEMSYGKRDAFVIKEALRNLEGIMYHEIVADLIKGENTEQSFVTNVVQHNDEIYLLIRLIMCPLRWYYNFPAEQRYLLAPIVPKFFKPENNGMREELEKILLEPKPNNSKNDAKVNRCKSFIDTFFNDTDLTINSQIKHKKQDNDKNVPGIIPIHTIDELIVFELTNMINHISTIPNYIKCEVCGRILRQTSKVKRIDYCDYVRVRDYPCKNMPNTLWINMIV